jgi:hypothetical protein
LVALMGLGSPESTDFVPLIALYCFLAFGGSLLSPFIYLNYQSGDFPDGETNDSMAELQPVFFYC